MASLRIGFAKVDITPPLCIPYLSHYPRQTPFEGVHDPLFARAMVADNGRVRLAIVSADSLGFSRDVLGPTRDFLAEFRQRVERRARVPAAHVMLAATHAHSTPQTTHITRLLDAPEAGPWLEMLLEQLASAVVQAAAQLRPATLRAGLGEARGIGWCRRIIGKDGKIYRLPDRPPDDQIASEPRDDRVGVLIAQDNGGRVGTLLNFTCHPTTVQVNPLVSADFPGVACDLVERAANGAPCLFLQGAAGNVNPVRHTTGFNDVRTYGRMLADEANKVAAALSGAKPMSDTLAVVGETLMLPTRADLPPAEETLRRYVETRRAIDAAKTEAERQKAIAAFRPWNEKKRLLDLGAGPVPCEVQVMRLGEAVIAANPGEMFCDFGLEIKQRSPARLTFVSAYTNGYIGYLPVPEAWQQGGYEPSQGPWTRCGPDAGRKVTEKTVELIQRVWK
ncbi:MAG: neutral/alkaline non-lysosomal ceramidase N-terminal domain-containing protein [Verrucomicrobiae bacterium]|nr:neutral/alkaline non-lysosomal ceramidase N-terminal domain-containing protein [Verrucomicrobiae bacterium]